MVNALLMITRCKQLSRARITNHSAADRYRFRSYRGSRSFVAASFEVSDEQSGGPRRRQRGDRHRRRALRPGGRGSSRCVRRRDAGVRRADVVLAAQYAAGHEAAFAMGRNATSPIRKATSRSTPSPRRAASLDASRCRSKRSSITGRGFSALRSPRSIRG